MKKYFLLLIVLSLNCAGSSHKTTYGPDGKVSYNIQCHPNIGECLEEAGNICGKAGYVILHHSTHQGGTLADYLPGPVTWHDVLISCN